MLPATEGALTDGSPLFLALHISGVSMMGEVLRFSGLVEHPLFSLCPQIYLHISPPLFKHNVLSRQSSLGRSSHPHCGDDGSSIFGRIVAVQYVEGLQELVRSGQPSFMETASKPGTVGPAFTSG